MFRKARVGREFCARTANERQPRTTARPELTYEGFGLLLDKLRLPSGARCDWPGAIPELIHVECSWLGATNINKYACKHGRVTSVTVPTYIIT
eukprot:5009511-Amphidinium_carterae.1